ncbi:MAG: ABC transporter permease [Candidatus Helarchaeales archaeon]
MNEKMGIEIEYVSSFEHFFLTTWGILKIEVLKYLRAKTRLISSIFNSVLFLIIFLFIGNRLGGVGIGGALVGLPFTASGLIVQPLLFSGMMMAVGLLIDKQFGFFKEIQVSPAPRTSIVVGKMLGGSINCMIQGLIITGIAIAFGAFGFDLFLIVRILLLIPAFLVFGMGMVGIGLIIATVMKDMHAFNLIMSFVVMPMFFMSGVFFPITSIPFPLQAIFYINPAVYGVDLFRFILTGISFLPIGFDFLGMTIFTATSIGLGVLLFRRMEV